jgi:hypothetical protein
MTQVENPIPNRPNPFLESMKELGRLLLITLVSYLLTEGMLDIVINSLFGTRIDAFTKAQVVGIVLFILRTIDKYLHEKGKVEGDPNLQGGLTRF